MTGEKELTNCCENPSAFVGISCKLQSNPPAIHGHVDEEKYVYGYVRRPHATLSHFEVFVMAFIVIPKTATPHKRLTIDNTLFTDFKP